MTAKGVLKAVAKDNTYDVFALTEQRSDRVAIIVAYMVGIAYIGSKKPLGYLLTVYKKAIKAKTAYRKFGILRM